MSSRTWRRLVALLAALVLAAAACGGNGGDGDIDTGAPDDGDGDLSGQEVEIAAVWSGTEQERFELVLDEFENQTGATVQFTSTGDEIRAVLQPRIAGGDAPDLAVLPQPGLLNDFAADGSLVAVEDIVGDTVDENYAPVWRELASVDGTLYGVWFKAANKSTVWYNTSVFEDAGVEPPEDWDGFLATAQTIGDFGVPPVSVAGADGWTLTDWFENVYLRMHGPETYDQLTNHEIPWTDQTVKDSLAVLAELFGNDELLVGGSEGALQTDFPTSVTQVFTDPPSGAIVYEGDFVAGVITGSTDAEVGTDARFFDFPAIDDSPPSVVGGGDVVVLMDDNEASRALLEFLASPEAAEIWAAEGGYISPNQNVDLDVYPDEISRELAASVAEAETFRFDMSDLVPSAFGGDGGALWSGFQDFLADPSDIDGVTQAMENAAETAFEE